MSSNTRDLIRGSRSLLTRPHVHCNIARVARAPTMSTQRWVHQAIEDRHDFHRYTRGRFVCDESLNMAKRHIDFNIHELQKVAAQAIGSQSCVNFEKLPEGLNGKAFLMTMNDGAQVVAKLPNPCGGRPHFTTASEVATMDYVRNKLGMPVPKVYAWCSRTQHSPVKAEYIIMGKAKGVPLQSVYDGLDLKQRWALVHAAAKYQLSWSEASFQKYGSLYYEADLRPVTSERPNPRPNERTRSSGFTIGPTAGVEWNQYETLQVEFDRGPWNTASEYFQAIGKRELLCVRQLKELPLSVLTLCGPGLHTPSRSRKEQAAMCYLDILHNLLPQDPTLLRPSLAHPDFHTENIFVNPDNPSEITAILDWSSAEIAPSLVQAKPLDMIDYEGPQLKGLERPTLPADLAARPGAEQRRARILYLQQSLVALYRTLIHKRYPEMWKCFEYQDAPEFEVLTIARRLLHEGEAPYLARIIELIESGSDIVALADPTDEPSNARRAALLADKDSILQYWEAAQAGADVMGRIQQTLGDLFPEQGVVRHDQYDEAKRALGQIKDKVIEEFARSEEDRIAWHQSWPFDD